MRPNTPGPQPEVRAHHRSATPWFSRPLGPTARVRPMVGHAARAAWHRWRDGWHSTWRCSTCSQMRARQPAPPCSSAASASSCLTTSGTGDLSLELEQVGDDAVRNGQGDLALPLRGPEEGAVFLVCRESRFDQDRRPAGRREDEELPLLHAVVLAGVDRRHLPLYHLRQSCRFAQILIELQVVQNESEWSPAPGTRGLEAQRIVFHLRHAFLVFGFRVRHEVGLDAVHLFLPPPRRHGIHVDAHKEVAVDAAEERAARQIDERIAGPGEHDIQAAPYELGAQQLADAEGDVLLRDPARQGESGIPGIDAAVSRIDDDRVWQPQTRDRVRRGECDGRRRLRRWAVIESRQPRIPAVAAGEQAGHIVGEPVQWQKQRVACDVRRAHHGVGRTRVPEERRSDIKVEGAVAERYPRRRTVERDREAEGPREQDGRHRRTTGLGGDWDVRLAARRRDQDLVWYQRGQQEEQDHDRLPFTTRAISRSATRRFKSSRLSWAFFAFASAIATLAKPSLK